MGEPLVQRDHARTLEPSPATDRTASTAARWPAHRLRDGRARRHDPATWPATGRSCTTRCWRRLPYDVLGVPGPNGGTAVAEALHILDHFDLAGHGWGSVEALLVIEASARSRGPVLVPGRPSGGAVRHPAGSWLRSDAGADDQPGRRRSRRRRRPVGMARGPAARGPSGSRGGNGGRRHHPHLGGGRGSQRRVSDADMSWSGVIVPGVGAINAMTWFYPAPHGGSFRAGAG